MDENTNRFNKFLRSSDGKKIQNRIFIIVTIVLVLVMVNRFLLITYISDDFKIAYNQSKLLFMTGVSPYVLEGQNYLSKLAENEGWKITNANTGRTDPIFSLIFFFPFTIIQNYQWSEAIFITINQICVLLSIHMLFDLLRWKSKTFYRVIIYLLSSTVFFIITNVMLANISVLQLSFLVSTLFFDEKKKPILSGIFFGLSLIDPISMIYFIITILIIFISTKKVKSLTWAFITVILMTLFSFIFDKNWIVGWLKDLFLEPSRYPFISFIESANLKYILQLNQIFTLIPIILVSWVLFEIIRTPKDTIEKKFWLLSIIGILNHYLVVQTTPNSEILFLPSLILLIGMWWNKINQKFKIPLLLILGILSYSIFKWSPFNLRSNNESILFILALFFTINLYWVRAWVMKPFAIND